MDVRDVVCVRPCLRNDNKGVPRSVLKIDYFIEFWVVVVVQSDGSNIPHGYLKVLIVGCGFIILLITVTIFMHNSTRRQMY